MMQFSLLCLDSKIRNSYTVPWQGYESKDQSTCISEALDFEWQYNIELQSKTVSLTQLLSIEIDDRNSLPL